MKRLTAIPFLVLIAITFVSVTLVAVDKPKTKDKNAPELLTDPPTCSGTEPNLPFHYIMHCWKELTAEQLAKFDQALAGQDETHYWIDYDNVSPTHVKHKGKLCKDEHCKPHCKGKKPNTSVTQQLRFATAPELKDFLTNAF